MSTKYVKIFPYNGGKYLQNKIFREGVEVLVLSKLKEYLKKNNIDINTYDIKTPEPAYKCVYFDTPYPWDIAGWKLILSNIGKNVLICHESSLIVPFNYWKVLHVFFNKVFTWYNPIVDNKKHFHRLWPKSTLGINTKPKKFNEKEFLVLINSNKLPFYPFKLINAFGRELYSERIKAIDFFERTIPGKFSLYGKGWNKPKKTNVRESVFGYRTYASYKGEVKDKLELLSRFKYCHCFENVTDIEGYITEKIFDCLKAKCIPIYWGATDITKYVPKECFIDFRDFGSYAKLLTYLDSIDEKIYNRYIKHIESLLADNTFRETWFEDSFADFFLQQVLTD